MIKIYYSGAGRCTHLISALGRQRKADLCVFNASLVHIASLGQLQLHNEMLSPKTAKGTSQIATVSQCFEYDNIASVQDTTLYLMS